MKTLYLRELRRMAPWGLGLVAVMGFAFAATAESALLFQGSLLLAAMMGVVSVAPDTSSGGVAFLARLPLSPARTIAIKALAAASYWVPAVLLALAIDARVPEAFGVVFWVSAVLGYAGFAFGAGLLASVVVARALPAVLVTPSLALLGFGVAAGVPLVVWRIPLGPFAAVSSGVFGVAFVVVAGVAFAWGDRHRRSFRPALIALATLTPVVLVGLGVTGAAHAWSVEGAVPELAVGPTPGVVSADGAHVALQLEGERWTGREQRVAIVSRAGDRAWVPDLREAVEPQFSPDSRHLLVRDAMDPGGWVIDLATRAVRPLAGAAPEGFGFEHAVWSRPGVPFFVRDRGGWLEGFDPTQPCDWDPRAPEPADARREHHDLGGWRLLGVRGEDLVLAHPERGLVQAGFRAGQGNPCGVRLELAAARAQVAWPAGMVSAQELLAPGGACALALPAGQGERPRVLLTRFGERRQVWLQTRAPGLSLDPTRVSWSPADASVALEGTDGSIEVFDALTGERTAVLTVDPKLVGTDPSAGRARGAATSRSGPVVWSPGGSKLALLRGLFELDGELRAQVCELRPGEVEPASPSASPGIRVGDRYFTTNQAGVIFYTASPGVELTLDHEQHCCKGPDVCYDPERFHGRARVERRPVDTTPRAVTWNDQAWSRGVVEPRSQWVPAAAAFLDGGRVIRLFEPLTVVDLQTGNRTRLLKGGE